MSDTVVVGCKYPTGVLIQVGNTTHAIAGTSNQKALIVEGAAITFDVPKALWDAWRIQNKNHDLVTKQFIFEDVKLSNVKAKAKEVKANKTKAEGLEKPNGDEVK